MVEKAKEIGLLLLHQLRFYDITINSWKGANKTIVFDFLTQKTLNELVLLLSNNLKKQLLLNTLKNKSDHDVFYIELEYYI